MSGIAGYGSDRPRDLDGAFAAAPPVARSPSDRRFVARAEPDCQSAAP